jgi:propanol-preferring alcohol dehydrogenase
MLSMQLTSRASSHLVPMHGAPPVPRSDEVVVRVAACGVCRTDLHVVDGELPEVALPRTPGHEIVGVVELLGTQVQHLAIGQRVGVPWLAWACGSCEFCRTGRENLCAAAMFTGYHVDGGFAEFVAARAAFVLPLPDAYDDVHAAPLLCAGLIGHRAYRLAGAARRLGLYGFGAAAHILAQVALHEGREVFAFSRPDDLAAMTFARELGVTWSGASGDAPPLPLDAAVIFAPVGALVPEALSHVVPGGTVVCAGIHMSDIPAFPYRLLWGERTVRSVANLTRADATDFLRVVSDGFVRTVVHTYPLGEANRALADLRSGRITGAAVLLPDQASRSPAAK